jgi:ATP-binding cassette subfamily G (WHITE) protein 2 (SNQ2)
VLFEAVVVGSLFFNMPKTSDGIFLRGGVLFFMLLFNALLALAELTRTLLSSPRHGYG